MTKSVSMVLATAALLAGTSAYAAPKQHSHAAKTVKVQHVHKTVKK